MKLAIKLKIKWLKLRGYRLYSITRHEDHHSQPITEVNYFKSGYSRPPKNKNVVIVGWVERDQL